MPTSTALSVNKQKGFTLVELLVVISIIAILAIIGLTVYSGLQRTARDSKRQADIKAISKAMEMHYEEFNMGVYDGFCQTTSGSPPAYDCDRWFSGGMPQDPLASGGTKKYCWINTSSGSCNDAGTGISDGQPNGTSWTVCATLESGSPFCISNQR